MEILSKERTIISNPNSIFSYFAWPSIARLSDGKLSIVCSGYRLRHICPFGKACISYSNDEGKSWSSPRPIIDTYLDDRDSGILVKDKLVIVTSFNNTINQQRIWANNNIKKGDKSPYINLILSYLDSVPENANDYLGSTYVISKDGGYTFSPIHFSPITSPHGPFLGKDDDILWVGKEYGREDCSGIKLYKYNYDDESFSYISSIPDCEDEYGKLFACEPHGIYMKNGDILVSIRAQRFGSEHNAFCTYISISHDYGKTFSIPYRINDILSGSPPHLYMHSSSTLILTYACRHGNKGIRVMISNDYGKTFSFEKILTENALTEDLGYPATIEKNDGNLITIWYEKCENGSVIRQIEWKL